MNFEGLEKREMIVVVDENNTFSVGFRKMPSGDECWANAVPADKSRHFAATSRENMCLKHRTGRPNCTSAATGNPTNVTKHCARR